MPPVIYRQITILSQIFLGLTYGLAFSLSLLIVMAWLISQGW